jgi:hypothetical protein
MKTIAVSFGSNVNSKLSVDALMGRRNDDIGREVKEEVMPNGISAQQDKEDRNKVTIRVATTTRTPRQVLEFDTMFWILYGAAGGRRYP